MYKLQLNIIKKQRKTAKISSWKIKDNKNFLKKKKIKDEKRLTKDIKILLKKKKSERHRNLFEDQKQSLVEYRRNYYLTYNK